MGNASNTPSLSSSQPTYTQPLSQVTTQYGSSYVSSSSGSPQLPTSRHGGGHVPQGTLTSQTPQLPTSRHGGGHVPQGALTSQTPQQNPNFIPQQPNAPYGQAPRGGSSQGYVLPEASGYVQQTQPQVRNLVCSLTEVLPSNHHRWRPACPPHVQPTSGKDRKSKRQPKYGVLRRTLGD